MNAEEVLEDFTRQMREARIANRQCHTSKSKRAYREAAAYARDHEWEAEALIADAAVLQLNQQLLLAEETLKRVLEMAELQLRGLAHFYRGSGQQGLGLGDAAIQSYELALQEDSRFDWKGWATNNLGVQHELRAAANQNGTERDQDEKKALSYYEKALKYDGPATYIRKYNYGRMCLKRGQYQKAVNWLTKAREEAWGLEQPDMSSCGRIGRDLGTAHFISATRRGYPRDARNARKIRDKAIPHWEEADKTLSPADPHSDCAKQDRDKATVVKAKLHRARRLLDERRRPESERTITPDTNDFLLLQWIPQGDIILNSGYSSPEERILTQILSARQDAYEKYAEDEGSRSESVLAILRGWGSAATLIDEGVANEGRGGGYFLKWRDKGLVIDPGIHFLRNFRDGGFHLREIDAVVVSHNHPDHNLDLGPFDDLRYELYKRGSTQDKRQAWRYKPVLDEDTYEMFRNRFGKRGLPPHIRRPAEIFGKDAYKEYVQNPPSGEADLEKVTINLQEKAGLPFRIRYFDVKHTDDVLGAVGFCVECLGASPSSEAKVKIGYTGDTSFFPELYDKNHLGDCDILIAHISQPALWELLSPDGVKEDAKHLGYRGMEQLIKGLNPRPQLTLIGEFWMGLADSRVDIAEGLRRACSTDAIMPSSVGMRVHPETRQILCSKCGDWMPPDKISVAPPAKKFGSLNYLCPQCCLGPRG